MLAHIGAMLAYLEGNMGPSWGYPSWGYLGPSWGLCCPMLRLRWPILRPTPTPNAPEGRSGPGRLGCQCLTLLSGTWRRKQWNPAKATLRNAKSPFSWRTMWPRPIGLPLPNVAFRKVKKKAVKPSQSHTSKREIPMLLKDEVAQAAATA